MAVSELFTAISEYVIPLTAQWEGRLGVVDGGR